jgi:hypothetical protein
MQHTPANQPYPAPHTAAPQVAAPAQVPVQANWLQQPAAQIAAAVLLLALLLVGAQSALLSLRQPTAQLALASRDISFLGSGFYAPEQDARGSYRWTAATAQVRLPVPAQGAFAVLRLHLGPAPPELAPPDMTLRLGQQPPARLDGSPEPRTYALLVPPAAATADGLDIRLQSDTFIIPPDTREVGLRLERLTLAAPGTSLVWLTPAYALPQVALLALAGVLLLRLRVRPLPATALLALLAAALTSLLLLRPLLLPDYVGRLAVAFVALALLTLLVLPLCERALSWAAPPALLRLLWGIALLACTLRLVGSLFPLFHAFDLGLNVERFITTVGGNLVVTSRSIEFRNGITVYPPGGYITLLPGVLLGLAPPVLIQGSLAIIDGFGAFTTGVLALALGMRRRAAILSAILYAAVPIHLTALWFGLTAQIFGQALMAPLALALLVALRSDSRRAWVAVAFLHTVALLTHIGVAIIGVAWLGLTWLALGARRVLAWGAWWRFAWLQAGCLLVSVIGTYGYVIELKLQEAQYVADKVQTSGYVPAYGLIVRAFHISFYEGGLLLLLPGLLLLWLWRHRLPRGGGAMIIGWLGVVGVFLGIELLSALQVRYLYFLTPLACIAMALPLAALARRGRAAQIVAWGILLLLLVQGSLIWYRGTFENVMMSMSPLLR